jgi:hypothetical protein
VNLNPDHPEPITPASAGGRRDAPGRAARRAAVVRALLDMGPPAQDGERTARIAELVALPLAVPPLTRPASVRRTDEQTQRAIRAAFSNAAVMMDHATPEVADREDAHGHADPATST